jgi:predicted RNase H-like nuclease
MNIFKRFEGMTLADVKEAVKRAADEHPETAAKLAWGAGITVFCACEMMAINKLGRVTKTLSKNLAKTIRAVNENATYAQLTRLMENNNVRAWNAQLDIIGEKLGINEQLCEAGVKASDEYLADIGTTREEFMNLLEEYSGVIQLGDQNQYIWHTPAIEIHEL